jgi:TRAP-type C4-dicarboxylate transport system permease small subunit
MRALFRPDGHKKTKNRASGLVRFEKLTGKVSNTFAWVSGIALVAMVGLSAVDMLAHKIVPTRWIFAGAFEISGLLAVLVISFAIPFTQLAHGHTEIDFFTNKLPRRVQVVLAFVFSLFTLALFAAMTWQMLDFARTAQMAGRITSNDKIPIAPFAYATAVCFILMCVVVITTLLKLVKGERK